MTTSHSSSEVSRPDAAAIPDVPRYSQSVLRTQAVLSAELLLCALAIEEADALDSEALREKARAILEHYPRAGDLYISSARLPQLWGNPDHPAA